VEDALLHGRLPRPRAVLPHILLVAPLRLGVLRGVVLRRLDLELQRVGVAEPDPPDGQVLRVPRILGDPRQLGRDAVIVEDLGLVPGSTRT
jgi:hypothetical protein